MNQASEPKILLPREAWPAIEDLPDGDMRGVAEAVGIDGLMRLYARFSATSIYFGHLEKILRRHRDTTIRREFDRLTAAGLSAREAVNRLAREFNLSDRWIWEIIGRPDERQMRMF